MEIHYFELRKFRQDKPHGLRTPFEKWLHVLRFGDIYDVGGSELPKSLNEEEGIAMALNEMRRAYASSEVRELMESREKAAHDEASRMERALTKGKLEIARRMLAAGMERETILRLTGLKDNELVAL